MARNDADEPNIHSSGIFDELTPLAEIFRSKLIEDFHLLESFDDHGHSDVPKFYSKDLADEATLDKMMLTNPHGLVKFHAYTRKDNTENVGSIDRRKNRVRNKNSKNPPIDMWAHYLLETSYFQNFMLILILANSLSLGLLSEVADRTDPSLAGTRRFLEIFDYCALFLFMVEILLKWVDNFPLFWKNGWNIFDFVVTVASFIPEIIASAAGDLEDLKVIVGNIRVFRIFRALKMVSRFRQARMIALAITKAFNAMSFILVLFLLFLYIFAITGIIFFDSYSRSMRDDLTHQHSFNNLGNAMITLFQLFTLDQWYKILKDMWKVMGSVAPTFYIMLWICIGSFIFKNLFVGIMVNNFQNIRNELFMEVKEQEVMVQMQLDADKFNEELERQDQELNTGRRVSSMKLLEVDSVMETIEEEPSRDRKSHKSVASSDALFRRVSRMMGEITKKSGVLDWEKTVHDNLQLLVNSSSETIWPRDTLFRYFQLMEALQENLQERQDLQNMTCEYNNNIPFLYSA
ncbi:cation channel sperm-associated protein 2-like [Strongylocentrotus purpuratus]|uniref:Ion transport domain-containing protein n=1 Tax=Strongylocentrotus purpuratus TaxID=7668 RepID=A0A7M7N7C9_STRPU|nr:cation channel sperm-associated protein 2-like [Strongylocentrotus purpuratus]